MKYLEADRREPLRASLCQPAAGRCRVAIVDDPPGRGRRSRSSTSTAPPATTTVIADRDTALVGFCALRVARRASQASCLAFSRPEWRAVARRC
jgi:hypothetical protein